MLKKEYGDLIISKNHVSEFINIISTRRFALCSIEKTVHCSKFHTVQNLTLQGLTVVPKYSHSVYEIKIMFFYIMYLQF